MSKLLAVLLLLSLCLSVYGYRKEIITVNTPAEAKYLVENHGACNEIGSDPFMPYTRIADHDMYYTYKYELRKGTCAFALLHIRTQFNIEISNDNKSWSHISDFRNCETLRGLTLIDFTPYIQKSGTVYLKFTDRVPEDGWGALLGETQLFTTDCKAEVCRIELTDFVCGGKSFKTGSCTEAAGDTAVTLSADIPAGWKGEQISFYIPAVKGTIASALINGTEAKVGRTWDRGFFIEGNTVCGKKNAITLIMTPEDGRIGIAAPARAGLRLAACAAPAAKLLDGRSIDPLRTQAPYTYDKMNYIAGNYISYIFDGRYNLLGFDDNEAIHYLHDTSRNVCALAEEERYTPVVRLELIQRLYEGLKGGILPSDCGDVLMSFKHDRRPVDIRPLDNTPYLTMVQKMDQMRKLCTIGVTAGREQDKYSDTPLKYSKGKWSFSRTWSGGGRSVSVNNEYWLGDMDTPSCLSFSFDGQGDTTVDLGRLAETNYWFRPGSWGPEMFTFPNGRQRAAVRGLDIAEPDFDYIIISGGNGMGSVDAPDQGAGLAAAVMWDKTPKRIYADIDRSGRWGGVVSDFHLVFPEDCKKVNIKIMPFMDYPSDQRALRTLVENVRSTGHFGMGFYNVTASTFGSGIGADGLAAAAYIFKKYNIAEAAEAAELAERAVQTYIKHDQAESGSNQLYHMIKAVLYLHLAGNTKYDDWAKLWADRIVNIQKENGSWQWLDYQVRNMSGLISAYEITGDDKYINAVKKAAAGWEYTADNKLLWNGIPSDGDFNGAGTFNVFGYFGDIENAQHAIDARLNYINDGGHFCCSDLNPYMLGLSAAGLDLASSDKKLILSLTESAVYDRDRAVKVTEPTANTYNQYHPLAASVDFPAEF